MNVATTVARNRTVRTILAAAVVASMVAIVVLGAVSVWANATALGRRTALVDLMGDLAVRAECRDDLEAENNIATDDVVLLLAEEGPADAEEFADALARLQRARDRMEHVNDRDVCGPLPEIPSE